LTWTYQSVEQELKSYRELVCQMEYLEADLTAWEVQIGICGDDCIEGAVLRKSNYQGMTHGTSISDKTAYIAISLPDEKSMKICKLNIEEIKRRTRRIESWIKALPNRQFHIFKMLYISGMTWREVVNVYNSNPTDGIPRDERTLRRWRSDGIKIILQMSAICP